MAKRLLAALAAFALIATSASAQSTKHPSEPPAPTEPPVWRTLEPFDSEAEFLAYVRLVQRINTERRRLEYSVAPPAPPPAPMAADGAAEAVVVTGALANNSPADGETSITNVQTHGVDEGGIVKMIGRFLITLQDGRLFVTDTRPNGQPGLQFVGRTNVYRHTNHNVWYDEMLVSGNRILVTGYSYAERASEINVFTIDENGAITRETAYYISSNDYYDTENYATRLVNGNLVIYTPLALSYINTERPMSWPLVRRWLRDDDHQAITTAGVRLFDARSIYRPVQATRAPIVHSVSVCPLGSSQSGDELECRTTAFVGTSQREFYVSPSDIFVWASPQPWADLTGNPCQNDRNQSLPATLYRISMGDQRLQALHVRGRPDSQLAMDANAAEFRALVNWNNCGGDTEVRYFRASLRSFNARPATVSTTSFVQAPSPGSSNYEVRFTDAYVVYGGRPSYSSYPPEGRTIETALVIALPIERPTAPTTLNAPHGVLRIERVGDNIALTGYRTDAGLSLSLVDLRGRPRIASSLVLGGRFESENRSHAFNSLIGADGSGVMGLATVTGVKESGRWVFRSRASDVSYVSVDVSGRLRDAGPLEARGAAAVDSRYNCEVSCVDWYGNTRALFLGSRLLGLSGTELIEGLMRDGRIEEVRRVNLSTPPPRS
jgi:hypothetical protein